MLVTPYTFRLLTSLVAIEFDREADRCRAYANRSSEPLKVCKWLSRRDAFLECSTMVREIGENLEKKLEKMG